MHVLKPGGSWQDPANKAHTAELENYQCNPPVHLPSHPAGITTPLWVCAWTQDFNSHPEKEFAMCIVKGITNGLHIGSSNAHIPGS